MSNHQTVNNIDHKDLKINTKRCAELGDNIWYTLTFPDEFRAVQAYYPIFFQKDPQSGRFMPVALFGFQHEENLFLDDNGWDAGYIPIAHARMPFLIGSKQGQADTDDRVLLIDRGNPRVNESEGEPLFLEFGGNTDYLDNMAAMLEALHHGITSNTPFIDCLIELELLEPFTMEVQLNNGSKNEMHGFYTINEERLAQLPDDKLAGLVKSGYLKAIHMTMASQGNIGHLIKRKNAKLGL